MKKAMPGTLCSSFLFRVALIVGMTDSWKHSWKPPAFIANEQDFVRLPASGLNIHSDCFQILPPFLSLAPFPTQPRSLPQLDTNLTTPHPPPERRHARKHVIPVTPCLQPVLIDPSVPDEAWTAAGRTHDTVAPASALGSPTIPHTASLARRDSRLGLSVQHGVVITCSRQDPHQYRFTDSP